MKVKYMLLVLLNLFSIYFLYEFIEMEQDKFNGWVMIFGTLSISVFVLEFCFSVANLIFWLTEEDSSEPFRTKVKDIMNFKLW